LLGRLGLPENIDQAIAKFQRLIMVIRLLHTSIIALQAATGPLGIALALVGIASAAISMTDLRFQSGE
jgi:hypothetical protein